MIPPLTDYPTAKSAYRTVILTAPYEGWATEAKNTRLVNIPGPFVQPDWMGERRAHDYDCGTRLVGLNRRVGEQIAAGLKFPDLDAIVPITDGDYTPAMREFLTLGGAVASALALHGVQDTRVDWEGVNWRRVCPFAPWPQEALIALEAAIEAANRFAPIWLSHMAQFRENTFAGALYAVTL